MKLAKINLAEIFSKLPSDDYCVRVIAMMNNYEIKSSNAKASQFGIKIFDTDETFIILEGKINEFAEMCN